LATCVGVLPLLHQLFTVKLNLSPAITFKIIAGQTSRSGAFYRCRQKIADAFEVSLDHLVGEGMLKGFDKKTLQRLYDLEQLEEDKKKTFLDLIDTYIRDAKGRKAYAS
jgi:hypothetical protein